MKYASHPVKRKAWRGAFVLMAIWAAAFADAHPGPRFGEIEVLSSTTPPFPEGISVDRGHIYVSGPATFGTAGAGPSKVFIYDARSGVLQSEISVEGENLEYEHTLGCNAVDAQGRLYALTTAVFAPDFARLGVVRFTKLGRHYRQDFYTPPFANLPSCGFGPLDTSCALPNDFAFAADGSAYVTDSFQAVIWRIPPNGGTPQVWLYSPRFAGTPDHSIGPNGIRLDPRRRYVYIAMSATSSIYRVPLEAHPTEAVIELFHQYAAGEEPDGIAFGASGKLYVALAGVSEISVLARNGSEAARISSTPADAIPLDGPANIAFDDASRSLLVTNHAAVSGNPAHFALLRIFVNDIGDPLEKLHVLP